MDLKEFLNQFTLFDPAKGQRAELPAVEGNYIVVLKAGCNIPDVLGNFKYISNPQLSLSTSFPVCIHPLITEFVDDNVESNCFMTRKYSSKKSEFTDFICIFAASSEFCLFSLPNTKISENSDMARFEQQKVTQVLKKFN